MITHTHKPPQQLALHRVCVCIIQQQKAAIFPSAAATSNWRGRKMKSKKSAARAPTLAAPHAACVHNAKCSRLSFCFVTREPPPPRRLHTKVNIYKVQTQNAFEQWQLTRCHSFCTAWVFGWTGQSLAQLVSPVAICRCLRLCLNTKMHTQNIFTTLLLLYTMQRKNPAVGQCYL
jgi:hypothetical protein